MEAMAHAGRSPVFQEGELALLVDRKNRRYLVTLRGDRAFHSHVGALPHSEVIGSEPGSWFRTSHGQALLALRPTFADYVLEVPRVTQVVYPKDLGAILVLGDIFPGALVVEAGLGSGALTAALLRAVGERGRVVTYEIEEGYVARGLQNVRAVVPDTSNLEVRLGDIYQGIAERGVDRVVLDVPEPWHVVPHAAEALVPSGVFLSYLPTILQVHRLVEALHQDGRYQMVETVEVLLRPWYVTAQSVRPVHRMVAHTAFLVTARRCRPRGVAVAPEPAAAEALPQGAAPPREQRPT